MRSGQRTALKASPNRYVFRSGMGCKPDLPRNNLFHFET
jgi:hypothetical protein